MCELMPYLFKPQVVRDNLMSNGICINYDPWFFHGESIYVATSSRATNSIATLNLYDISIPTPRYFYRSCLEATSQYPSLPNSI